MLCSLARRSFPLPWGRVWPSRTPRQAVSKPGLVAMTVPGGVDWKMPDGKPSDLIFLIAAPDTEANVHLEVLAKLSALLMHPEFPAALRAATTVEELLATIDDAEAAYDAQHAAKSAPAAKASTKDAAPRTGENGLPLILAITACPTGIAHTYMAAENLEKVAGEMGVTIKVETQGFVGGWIAKQGFTLGYLATAMDAEAQGALISGGFIAALFAGFAAGYLTLGFEKLCDRLPDSLEGIKPVLLYPLVSVFGIGLVMLALNPIFAAINTWLTDVLNGMGTGNLVLPSCIVGSAIAGAISAGFGCTSPAPHGGAWVIAVIGNPVMYLVALVVGAVVAALVLSFLKKPLSNEEAGLVK